LQRLLQPVAAAFLRVAPGHLISLLPNMRKRYHRIYFRLALALLLILIGVILYAIWTSQQKVNVIDKELMQKQVN
jgi:hypothetical protein